MLDEVKHVLYTSRRLGFTRSMTVFSDGFVAVNVAIATDTLFDPTDRRYQQRPFEVWYGHTTVTIFPVREW